MKFLFLQLVSQTAANYHPLSEVLLQIGLSAGGAVVVVVVNIPPPTYNEYRGCYIQYLHS